MSDHRPTPRRTGMRRRVLLSAILLVIAITALTLLYVRGLQDAPVTVGQARAEDTALTPEATVIPIEATSESSELSEPPSAINSEIAFISNRDGNWEIYVMQFNGGPLPVETVNLTNHPANDWFPSYAFDGQRMNFLSDRTGEIGPTQMNPDGSNQRELNILSAISTLVFENRLYWDAAWSPDGQRIVGASLRDLNLEIYRFDLASGLDTISTNDLTRLTEHPAYDWYPAWSPDGKRIAFASERDGNEEIYVMDANGDNLRRLTKTDADELYPVWSLDGKQIAFMSERENALTTGALDLFVVEVDGENPAEDARKLTAEAFFEGDPAWSPDGKTILFMSNREGDWNIYAMNADGSRRRRLTESKGDDLFPIWRPR